jgi:hypothetical protein
VNVIGRWKRQALCAGTLLAAGLLGSGCMRNEETAGGSLAERREAQLRAQSFESYGDGRLPQEVNPAPQQGTGGSGGSEQQGAAPGTPAQGTMVGQPVPAQGSGPAWSVGGQAAPAQGSPAAAPGASTPAAPGQGTPSPQEQERPRRDSGSSPEDG